MSLGKKDIIINITSKTQISSLASNNFLNSFLDLIKSNTSSKILRIPNFGTFQTRYTPQRLGRNPKTKEEFIISKRSKLFFKPSNKIKSVIN